ncbi:MAG: dienelactone hydrolase family protein [Chloroflexota bacterium]
MQTVLTWVKRIIFAIVGLIGLIMLIFVGIILFDAAFGSESTELTNVTYQGTDGSTLHGYLATPDGPGPHPAVLLIHEWWGLNEGIIVLADALAEEGYVVLAADAYRGEVTSLFPRALWLRVTTPPQQIFDDVDAALDHLLAVDNVNTKHVASMGFCFGGGQSLQLGMRQSEKLAATIMYYGAVVTDLEILRASIPAGPVFGIFGEEDQQILAADVLEFEANLNSLAIENEITIYSGVGHGFLNEENYNQPGTPMDAWQQTLRFLNETMPPAS